MDKEITESNNTEDLELGSVVEKRNRQALYDRLAGFSNEQISIRRGIPPAQVQDCIAGALEDLQSRELHSGVRGRIVNRLIENILELDNWKSQLRPVRTMNFEALDSKGQVHALIKDEDKDRELIPKYMGELRQLYTLLYKMVQLDVPDAEDEEKDKVNNAILNALITVAQKKGALEEKLDREQQKVIDTEVVEAELIPQEE